jgi:hypothetical protein
MSTALVRMRAFAAPRAVSLACELCAGAIQAAHDHLVEPEHRRLSCVCRPGALLFPSSGDGKRLRVEPLANRLRDLELDDATWAALGVPVGLAFFFSTHRSGDVIATFPGRAGTVESVVPPGAWQRLCALSPEIARLARDVEALLVWRTATRREYARVSIDRCYELAGLLRTGPGPMSTVEPEIVDSFFAAMGGEATAS